MRSHFSQENESLARECEKWCEVFPVLFPKRTLTRKMIELSLVMPKFVREQPSLLNKILRLEQEGERLHAIMNRSETKFKGTKRKYEKYWQMLEDHENKIYD